VDEASVRVQLEGRAELLEATLLRYRVLVGALKSWRWKARLRANALVFQEVARVQDDVDEALRHVGRRAATEGWAPRFGITLTHGRVDALRAELVKLISRRLDQPLELESLRPGIEALETQVLTAPRLILPGQRWSTALQVLPPNLPELQRAVKFGRSAEVLFGRPAGGAVRLPFSLEELDEFTASWSDGVGSLDAVWQHLVRIDATGALVRFLRRRARRTLTAPPRSGPELLLYAEFWRNMALSRIEQVLDERLSPIEWEEAERFPLVRWVWHREHNLPAKPGVVGEARSALFELAAALSELPKAMERTPLVLGGLIPVARLADKLKTTADWKRLHDELRLLVRVVWAPKKLRPPEPQETLEDLVRALRDAG
jgi:hypothetical protein